MELHQPQAISILHCEQEVKEEHWPPGQVIPFASPNTKQPTSTSTLIEKKETVKSKQPQALLKQNK